MPEFHTADKVLKINIHSPIQSSSLSSGHVVLASCKRLVPFCMRLRNISLFGFGKLSFIQRRVFVSLAISPNSISSDLQKYVTFFPDDETLPLDKSEDKERVQKGYSLAVPLELELTFLPADDDSFLFSGFLQVEKDRVLVNTLIDFTLTMSICTDSYPCGTLYDASLRQSFDHTVQVGEIETISAQATFDVLIVFNSSISRETLEVFTELLLRFKLSWQLWNISVHYTVPLIDVLVSAKCSLIVVFESLFFRDDKVKSASQEDNQRYTLFYFPSSYIFSAARDHSIHSLVLTDYPEICDKIWPTKLIRPGRQVQAIDSLPSYTNAADYVKALASYSKVTSAKIPVMGKGDGTKELDDIKKALSKDLSSKRPDTSVYLESNLDEEQPSGCCSCFASAPMIGYVVAYTGTSLLHTSVIQLDLPFGFYMPSFTELLPNQLRFSLVKLLPFSTKLVLFVNSATDDEKIPNIDMNVVYDSLLSDLIDEISIYANAKNMKDYWGNAKKFGHLVPCFSQLTQCNFGTLMKKKDGVFLLRNLLFEVKLATYLLKDSYLEKHYSKTIPVVMQTYFPDFKIKTFEEEAKIRRHIIPGYYLMADNTGRRSSMFGIDSSKPTKNPQFDILEYYKEKRNPYCKDDFIIKCNNWEECEQRSMLDKKKIDILVDIDIYPILELEDNLVRPSISATLFSATKTKKERTQMLSMYSNGCIFTEDMTGIRERRYNVEDEKRKVEADRVEKNFEASVCLRGENPLKSVTNSN